MKNRKWLVIGGVVILGIVVLIMNRPKSNPPKVNTLPSGEIIKGGVLSEALRSGADVTCTFTNKQAQTEGSPGSIKISKNRFRLDSSQKEANGNVSVSHVISNGKQVYVWTSLGQGLKIELDQLTTAGATNSAESILQSYSKLSGQSEVNCARWQLDETAFDLPKGIEFVDITDRLLQYKTQN